MDPTLRLVSELAEAARQSKSRLDFRQYALARLQAFVAHDRCWFHTMDERVPLSDGVWTNFDMSLVEFGRSGCMNYWPQLRPLRERAHGQGGVAVDTEVFGTRDRRTIPFYTDVADPLRMRTQMWSHLVVRGSEIAVVGFSMNGANKTFPDAARQTMRAVIPVLAIADGFLQMARPMERNERELARLTRREREVIDFLVLGYTNAEIGLAQNTVRNHLSNIFRKVGASTRAELVAIVLQH